MTDAGDFDLPVNQLVDGDLVEKAIDEAERFLKKALINARILLLTGEWMRTYLLLRRRPRRGLPVAAPGQGIA